MLQIRKNGDQKSNYHDQDSKPVQRLIPRFKTQICLALEWNECSRTPLSAHIATNPKVLQRDRDEAQIGGPNDLAGFDD